MAKGGASGGDRDAGEEGTRLRELEGRRGYRRQGAARWTTR